MECYYDHGGEDLIFEDYIDLDSKYFKGLDVFTLFHYCPECGHKINLSKYKQFIDRDITDFLISGKE